MTQPAPPKPPTQREREALAAWASVELAKLDLIEFCCRVDPNAASNYRAPHLRKIADALEDVAAGRQRRLFITAPPRHWKSSLTSEKFPLWFLARNPSSSIGVFSHGTALPTRFSKTVKGNIEFNPRFQELFPDIKLKDGSGNMSDWSLVGAFRSSFRSFGVGSGPTGEGFDLIVVDDPVADAAEAYSPTILESVWTWYKETLRDRLNPNGRVVLVMSRWHENDLAGKLLRASESGDGEKWEELRIPAIAEKDDLLGRAEGEALWPEVWPIASLEAAKKGAGSRAFAARFQGSPKAMEGNVLDSAKLVMVDLQDVPPLVNVLRHWDLAFSDSKTSDSLCGCKMGVDAAGNRYILHLKMLHGRWPKNKPVIVQTALNDGAHVTCSVEANGTQLGYFQEIHDDERMVGRRVIMHDPEGSKEMRASIWGGRLEDGIVRCVRAEWNGEFFDQMDYFPNAEHDDMVDAVSGAWAQLAGGVRNLSDSMMPCPPRPESPVEFESITF